MMKYVHYVYIANSYKYGDRIAYDLVMTVEEMDKAFDEEIQDKVKNFLLDLKNIVGDDTLITSHIIVTNSDKWESVVEKDTFFKDLKLIKNQKNFMKHLVKNMKLCKYDITSLVIALIDAADVEKIDTKNIAEELYNKYLEENNEELYIINEGDKKRVLDNKTIKRCSNIIFDRILSSENGFVKFEFVLKEIKNKLGKPLIIG